MTEVERMIKCDESELFDFFESEPGDIGEKAAGIWIYTYQKDDFKIVLSLSIYEMNIDISICYRENIVYIEMFSDIIEIKKLDINTLKIIKDGKRIIVKKAHQIGVIVEDN